MPSFSKAFVSHSSADKPLVDRIAQRVAAARWEIDNRTFEEGRSSAAEIFAALSRSDLFVLIASASSISSKWVQSELEIAQNALYSKKLGGVLVFIVDGTSADTLPEWVRMYVYVRSANETRIANLIRSRLIQLDAQKGIQAKPFVQRNRLRDTIERRVADLTHPVGALYVSGVDGIGRRAIVTNTLGTLFPSTDVAGIEISLSDGEGLLELYRKLHFAWHRLTLDEAKAFFDRVSHHTKEQLTSETAKLISEIGDNRMLVWLHFDYEVLDDDGNLQPDFRQLFSGIRNRRPGVIIRAKRMPRFAEQRRFDNIGFFKVDSLSQDESKLLWVYALDYLHFPDLDARFLAFLQENVSGHPAMIWTAAEYVAASGKAATEANFQELLEMLRALSLSLVDGLNLSTTSRRLLALFDEFGTVDPGDLIEIADENDQAVSEAVTSLMSLGLLESEGDHLKLAPYFRNARFRKQFQGESDAFLGEARRRLLRLVSTYTAEDNVSFETIDAVVATAISQGKPIPLEVGDRAVVGSHFLRVARGSYDRERFRETVGFASEALKKRYTLTEDATIEALRLLGMASIRTGDRENLDEALIELEKLGTRRARRHVHFIKGFDLRWNGDYDHAEGEFREVLKITANDTHALREMAQLLISREDYDSAERYARDALARNPRNPFLLDILVGALIERRKAYYLDLLEDEEIQDLLDQLEIADRREKTDFYDLRRALYHAALSDFSEAIDWADSAVKKAPGQVRPWAARAEIKLRIKGDPAVLHSIEADINQIQELADSSRGVRTHVSLLAKLRIRLELAKSNLRGAIRQYEAAPIHGQLRAKLAREIALQAVEVGAKEPEVVAFANRILST